MAFDEALAERIRSVVDGTPGLAEKKMFGGLAFLLEGNMACGVHGDDVIVRLDPAETDEALDQPHVRVFDLTGRPMKGWLLVGSAAVASDEDLSWWVDKGVEFARSLPPK